MTDRQVTDAATIS